MVQCPYWETCIYPEVCKHFEPHNESEGCHERCETMIDMDVKQLPCQPYEEGDNDDAELSPNTRPTPCLV
jgi:hypothetical protein